ncbi:hypothetical protein Aconfl_05280 [Algoriphagus confluentis]|uniref:Uncharacterized protein n=1 Tax=Algoriphagus confluentis TaxID=1697556 RepID=A0ABQ6PJT0_9BACT|nr:hypothetical protein Aconfl_05280 [Algoriphagus confluentis]
MISDNHINLLSNSLSIVAMSFRVIHFSFFLGFPVFFSQVGELACGKVEIPFRN